jgi:hypothetical protein
MQKALQILDGVRRPERQISRPPHDRARTGRSILSRAPYLPRHIGNDVP